jgi:hypothetical protein
MQAIRGGLLRAQGEIRKNLHPSSSAETRCAENVQS